MKTEPEYETVLAIARTCHEANRVVQEHFGDRVNPPWDQAPEYLKESTIQGVSYALEAVVGPEKMHNKWLEHRRRDGWTYGEVKDEDAKTHPCMVEYEELPAPQRLKDILFLSIVRSYQQARLVS